MRVGGQGPLRETGQLSTRTFTCQVEQSAAQRMLVALSAISVADPLQVAPPVRQLSPPGLGL